jgi:hypothetical protein
MTRGWFVFALLGAGCEKLASSEHQLNAQCVRDEDCALVPSAFTCCPDEACPPAPPFRAAPTWVVDGMYLENEHRCLAPELECVEPRCTPVPRGCSAKATCAAGRCTAIATGCGFPTS